jgi:FAD/FMN-containing dehydrogenase
VAVAALDMLEPLRRAVGAHRVDESTPTRQLLSQDVYRAGVLPLAVVRPASTAEVQAVVQVATQQGLALFVRGGGMSYTDAYLPDRTQSLLVDLSGLNRIRSIEVEDLTATVEAGCTWSQLDDALAPHGLRAVFWGPMSGARATIGGGMSQGAATFGSGRHGSSAAAALGFEVVLGDGSLLDTGRIGRERMPAFFRPYGPDLTGLFTGDAGALGIKTAISLQLEPRPARHGALAFSFDRFEDLRRAVTTVSRAGLATEIFGLENSLGSLVAGDAHLAADLQTAWRVARSQGSLPRALKQLATMGAAGRRFIENGEWTANFVAEATDDARLALALNDIRAAVGSAARETANTMGAVVRATPFPPPQVLGPGGRRLLPLHVILPHSRLDALHVAFEALRAREAERLKQHQVLMFVVFAGVGRSSMLYEPVLYWSDSWSELHRSVMPAEQLAQMPEAAPNPAARAYVEALRGRIVDLMRDHAGAHLQIGRAYPYLDGRDAPFIELLRSIKRRTDPQGLINPGALGLQDAAAVDRSA